MLCLFCMETPRCHAMGDPYTRLIWLFNYKTRIISNNYRRLIKIFKFYINCEHFESN